MRNLVLIINVFLYLSSFSQSNDSTLKYYDKARKMFKVSFDKSNMGYDVSFNEWIKVDSVFMKVNEIDPDFQPAYLYRARIYSNIDPDCKQGLAKFYYEKVIEKSVIDLETYKKDILEAYNYLGYYYLVNEQYCESINYWKKINRIDTENKNAIQAMETLKSRCKN